MAAPTETPVSPQEEAAAARALLARGELSLAAQHVGRALAADPANAAWRALLDQIIAKAGDALRLFPPSTGGKGLAPETAAVRAYVLAHVGRYAEAVNLLIRVAGHRPAVPYLDWASDWLGRDAAAIGQVDRKALVGALHNILPYFRGVVVKDPVKRRGLEAVRAFLDFIVAGPDDDPALAAARVTVMRKLGLVDRALVEAGRAYKSKPSYHVAAALAGVYQARKDDTNWMKWAQQALKHDPANVPSRVDLGDAYFDRENYGEAARWYQEAVERQKDHPWALPSLYAARYRAGEKGEWLAKLMRYAEDNPGNERAKEVLTPLLPEGTRYTDDLPVPHERTLDTLRKLERQGREAPDEIPPTVEVSLPYLESPSSRVALRYGLESARLNVHLDFSVAELQKPDPRLPRTEVEFQAWTYPDKRVLFKKIAGTDPAPAGTDPSPWLGRRVAEFAARGYDRAAWYAEARLLATELGAKRVEEAVGTLSRPPKPPKDEDAPGWVYRVQVATALVLANLNRTEPWPDSLRKRVLFDLARGPLDWTVNAAIIALTALVQEEPDAVEDVKQLFYEELLKTRPKPGYVCYLHPLVCCAQQLPGMTPEERATLIEWQLDLEHE